MNLLTLVSYVIPYVIHVIIQTDAYNVSKVITWRLINAFLVILLVQCALLYLFALNVY